MFWDMDFGIWGQIMIVFDEYVGYELDTVLYSVSLTDRMNNVWDV